MEEAMAGNFPNLASRLNQKTFMPGPFLIESTMSCPRVWHHGGLSMGCPGKPCDRRGCRRAPTQLLGTPGESLLSRQVVGCKNGWGRAYPGRSQASWGGERAGNPPSGDPGPASALETGLHSPRGYILLAFAWIRSCDILWREGPPKAFALSLTGVYPNLCCRNRFGVLPDAE